MIFLWSINMKKIFLFIIFLTSVSFAKGQTKLYGQYVAGDAKEEVAKYDRSMRLNGMYYYIEPHFNKSSQLYKVRLINHDYVTATDYPVVLKHAQRLVELMEYKYGHPDTNKKSGKAISCSIDTPYMIALWKQENKEVQIDIDCKDGNYLYITLTITAKNLASDHYPHVLYELAEK